MNAPDLLDADPYQTLADLDEAHTELLQAAAPDAMDDQDRTDESERHQVIALYPSIAAFLNRAAAAGAYLDEPKARRSAQAKLDYWATLAYSAGIDIARPMLVANDPTLRPKLPDDRCPYRGLQAFDANSSGVFFGREEQVRQMERRLERGDRLIVVTGRSGSGKSSLVLGGLQPHLVESVKCGEALWRIVPPAVPGTSPLVNLLKSLATLRPELAERVARDAEAERLRCDAQRLPALLAESANGDRPVVLVIDQFEEAITLRTEANTPDHDALVAALLAACKVAAPQHRVILTMRRDVEPQLARLYPELNRLCAAGALLPISAMDPKQLRDAIVRPAEIVGLRFQEGVVDELVQSVNGEDAGLPLLQFALMALWDSRPEHGNLITRECLRRVGSPRKAMAAAAQRLYDSMDVEQQTATRKLLPELTRSDGATVFRNRVTRGHLKLAVDENSFPIVLAKLESARLLRITQEDPDHPELDLVEVAHEALLRNWELLDRWLLERRNEQERRAFLRKLAEAWSAAQRAPDYLLAGLALKQAHSEFDEVELLPVEQEYLAASDTAEIQRETARAEFDRQRLQLAERRRRSAMALAGWLGLAVVVSAVMLVWAGKESKEQRDLARLQAEEEIANAQATAKAESAKAREEAAKVIADARTEAQNATVAVVEAAKQLTTDANRERNDAQAYLHAKEARELENKDAEQAIMKAKSAVEAKPELLASVAPTLLNALRFIQPSVTLPAELFGGIGALALDADGAKIVVAGFEGVAEWPVYAKAERPLRRRSWPHPWQLVHHVAYSPDGRTIAVATSEGAWLWRPDRELQLLQPEGEVEQLTFSHDGRLLATAGDERRRLLAWSTDDGQVVLDERPFAVNDDRAGRTTRLAAAAFDAKDSMLTAIGTPRVEGKELSQSAAVYPLRDGRVSGAARLIDVPDCPRVGLIHATGGTRAVATIRSQLCMHDFAKDPNGAGVPSETAAQFEGTTGNGIVLGAGGRQLVKLIRSSKEAQVVDLDGGQTWRLQGAFDLGRLPSYAALVSVAANGQHVAIAAADESIRVYDLAGGRGPILDSGRVVWVSADEKLYMTRRFSAGRLVYELQTLSNRSVRASYESIDVPRDLNRYVATPDGDKLTAEGVCQDGDGKCFVAFDLIGGRQPIIHKPELRVADRKGDLLLESDKGTIRVFSLSADRAVLELLDERAAVSRIVLGNQRVFARSPRTAGGSVEVYKVASGGLSQLKSIPEASHLPEMAPRFYDDGRFLLVRAKDGRGYLHDLERPEAAARRVPIEDSLRLIVDGSAGLYAMLRREKDKNWEIRRLADGSLLGTLPADWQVEPEGRWAWGPDGPGRWQFRLLSHPDVNRFSVKAKEVMPWFSRQGRAVAINDVREERWLVHRLPTGEPMLEIPRSELALDAGVSSFTSMFEWMYGRRDADSFFTGLGNYFIDQEGRLIPTDARAIFDAAVKQVKH